MDDLEEYKGSALTLAIEKIADYDPARRTAYFFFYQIIRRHMRQLAVKPRPDFLGETDVDICFDELGTIPLQDLAKTARQNCSKNWRSFRLSNDRDSESAENYFRATLKLARSLRDASESKGERAALSVVIQTLKQCARDLIG